MTLTLDLPDEIANRLLALPEGERRNRYATTILSLGMDALTPEEAEQEHLNVLNTIREAISEADQGIGGRNNKAIFPPYR